MKEFNEELESNPEESGLLNTNPDYVVLPGHIQHSPLSIRILKMMDELSAKDHEERTLFRRPYDFPETTGGLVRPVLHMSEENFQRHLPPEEEPYEVLRELAVIVDSSSGDVCSLAAKAARIDLMAGLVNSEAIKKPVSSEGFCEIIADGNELTALPLHESLRRSVYKLGDYKGMDVIAWMDIEVKNRLFGDDLENDAEDIVLSPITIGISKAGSGRDLMVPVVKSMRTEGLCHVVFPTGAEIDDSTFNRPEILELTQEISSPDKRFDPAEFDDLLTKVHEAAELNPQVRLLNALVRRLEIRNNLTLVEKTFQNIKDRCVGYVTETLDRDDMEAAEVDVVAVRSRIKSPINNYKREWMFRLSRGKIDEVEQTHVRFQAFTLWSSMDPHEYGIEDNEVFPQFVITQDEFGNTRLDKYTSNEIETVPANDEQTEEFARIIGSLHFDTDALQAHNQFIRK